MSELNDDLDELEKPHMGGLLGQFQDSLPLTPDPSPLKKEERGANGFLGPVSQVLENELRQKVRRHGLVIWLDANSTYSHVVDRLQVMRTAGELTYDVHTFRGSFLELLFEIEPLTGGTSAKPLVVHMPGFNLESIRETPLLELYLAGNVFQKGLETLISEAASGKVLPTYIDTYLQQKDLSLSDADSWLASMLGNSGSTIAGKLRLVTIESLVDDLLSKPAGPISSLIASIEDTKAVWERFGAAIGLPSNWREVVTVADAASVGLHNRGGSDAGSIRHVNRDEIAFVVASWALCVEYVDDLHRAPVDSKLRGTAGLARPLIDACRALADHLRVRQTDFYTRTADETEAVLVEETLSARPEDLGKIDTFRFEEEEILSGALKALDSHDWASADSWSRLRIEGESFWLRREPARKSVWQLIADAAKLGLRIIEAGPSLGPVNDHHAAIHRYEKHGAAVDRAHRHLEQRRKALLDTRLPEYEHVRSCLDSMRTVWRTWADQWARDFNTLCRNHGFLPPAEVQQRNLFEQVVAPLISENSITALFVVDALRFEMAQELFLNLSEEKATNCRLDARLAELPTITPVGMNLLAPVSRGGKLYATIQNGSFKGFSTGEYRVSDPPTRQRAMHDRVGGKTCPLLPLQDVINRDATSLKRSIAKAKLVIVHSKEIDAAGEADFGPVVFDSVLKNIRAAWRLLREAGVKQFVFTADHGFLLREGIDDVQSHGRKIDPDRRHVVSSVAADHVGEVRVALADLGYENTYDFLMFPETTAAFDTGNRSRSFVHGGNSLQERVIPVLTLNHKQDAGGSTTKYKLSGRALEAIAGMHCIEATLTVATDQQSLDFGSSTEVELALRVPESEKVSVELCQVRRGARLIGGSMIVTINEPFELFFKLRGDSDQRVQIELFHPGADADVQPLPIENRFAIEVSGKSIAPTHITVPGDGAWLNEFPEGGIRQFFNHLATHGTVTESEATNILGDSRKLRRFATQFETLSAKAPFEIRIDVVNGVKRYVKEVEAEYKVN